MLDPSETYSLLKQLYGIGSKLINEDKVRILKLLEANDIKPEKCNAKSFELMNSLFLNKTSESKTIEPYLDSCIQRQFFVCRDIFSAQLKSGVDQLDKDTIELLVEIEEAFTDPSIDMYDDVSIRPLKPLEPHELARILDNFFNAQPSLSHQQGTVRHIEVKDMDKIVPKQISTISGICINALEATEAPLNNYIALGNRPSVVELLDNYALDWVEKLYLCHNILRGFEALGSKLVNKAVSRTRQTGYIISRQ